MALTDVTVPDIGDFKNIPIIEILVAPGDEVTADQPLMTLESDKATMDVPAPAAGKVVEVLVKVGDRVSQGTAILRMEGAGGGAAAQTSATPAPAAAAPAPTAPTPAPATTAPAAQPGRFLPPPIDFGNAHASPSVRRLARELDVDLTKIKGSGESGRITKDDVKAFLGAGKAGVPALAGGGMGIPEIPTVDFSKWGPVETKPLPRIKRISGPHLHRSWLNVPHVTHTDEADITEIDAYRKDLDNQAKTDKKAPFRVSLLPFLMKASVATLKQYPEFNASLTPEKDALVLKRYYNIGVAVDTPEGLVVAVLKDVDRKGILEISRELGDMSEKARAGKLPATDMQGATFTISSLGGIGGIAFTPIVNAPEVAILGVVRSKMQPQWNGKEFVPRLMLPLCLSYDHRVIDGAAAARFTRHLAVALEDLRRLIL